jgi:uncharacterized protein YegP (UPF0339 family)
MNNTHVKSQRNGIIVQSFGYATKEECLEAIEQVKRFADVAIVSHQTMYSYPKNINFVRQEK